MGSRRKKCNSETEGYYLSPSPLATQVGSPGARAGEVVTPYLTGGLICLPDRVWCRLTEGGGVVVTL